MKITNLKNRTIMNKYINKYPDGASYVNLEGVNLSKRLNFKINSYENLWHLNQFVDAYNSRYDSIPIITIPNLIDGQADRRFNKSHSHGLKLVCGFLNEMNAKFKIYHPHNQEVVEALIDNVEIIDNHSFIEDVTKEINTEDLILMASDAGGFKPLIKLCEQLNWGGAIYSASKGRNPINNKLTQIIDRNDFNGKDILIIDDCSIYGGTFKGLSKLLRDRNCGKLYLAVSHMTVQDLGYDPFTNYFDKVFTTNSKFDSYYSNDEILESNLTVYNYF
jgi:ribose-phosphate pyrophosphokinase